MKRILIIDDDASLRLTLKLHLRNNGYECVDTPDGRSGLNAALDTEPDLILCDIQMPGLSGYDVLQELRLNPQTESIPFIFLSGLSDNKDMRRGLRLGADDYITKPVEVDELLEEIAMRLKRQETVSNSVDRNLENFRKRISLALPHELKTPLVSILGYSNYLLDEFDELQRDEAVQMISAIYQSGRRLERTIENYLYFVKLEIQEQEAIEKKLAPAEIARADEQALLKTAQELATEFNRYEDLTLKVQPLKLQGIPESVLKKVVTELLSNAFKFSYTGSSVKITTKQTEKNLLIIVSDQGRGMTPDQVKEIGAYVQFDRDKFEQQGIGLGLSIVKRLADKYTFEVKIESVMGEGTRVTLLFPLNKTADNRSFSA